MSLTAHEQKNPDIHYWELFATWKAKWIRKRECKGWGSDPAQAGMGPVSAHKKSSIHHSILADTRDSQYWPESPAQGKNSERVYNSPLFANVSLSTPSWPMCRWSEWGQHWGTTPVSQTLSLGHCGHPFPCTCSSPFFTKTFGVMQGQSSSLFPELPHSSPRTI